MLFLALFEKKKIVCVEHQVYLMIGLERGTEDLGHSFFHGHLLLLQSRVCKTKKIYILLRLAEKSLELNSINISPTNDSLFIYANR